MTTDTLTITDFLLARIAADEGLIRFRTPQLDIGSQRWLAECEAKRRIMAWHNEDDQGRCVDDHHYPYPCPTIKYLALPYADHPDYRKEWRA